MTPKRPNKTPPASTADPPPSPAWTPRLSPIGFAYNLRREDGTHLRGPLRPPTGAAARFTRFATRAAAVLADSSLAGQSI